MLFFLQLGLLIYLLNKSLHVSWPEDPAFSNVDCPLINSFQSCEKLFLPEIKCWTGRRKVLNNKKCQEYINNPNAIVVT